MEERRRIRRFTLNLPCLIHDWSGSSRDFLLQTRTRNVGIGGASIDSSFPLPTGMRIGFTLLIRFTASSTNISRNSCVSLTARVLRSDNEVIAVAFGDAYRILPTVHLADQCRAVSQCLDQWAQASADPTIEDIGFGALRGTDKFSFLAAFPNPPRNDR